MALVVWSGGCDSTLVLYNLCQEQKLSEPVRAVAIHHNWVGAIEESERARRAILDDLRGRGHKIVYHVVKITLEPEAFCNQTGLVQPMLWLPAVIPMLRENEELYFGYIRSDDVWHYREWFYRIAQDMMIVMHKDGAKLVCPLEWSRKREVVAKLKEVGLLDKIWTCEFPNDGGTPCGGCLPCVALAEAKRKLSIDDDLKLVAKAMTARKPLSKKRKVKPCRSK